MTYIHPFYFSVSLFFDSSAVDDILLMFYPDIRVYYFFVPSIPNFFHGIHCHNTQRCGNYSITSLLQSAAEIKNIKFLQTVNEERVGRVKARGVAPRHPPPFFSVQRIWSSRSQVAFYHVERERERERSFLMSRHGKSIGERRQEVISMWKWLLVKESVYFIFYISPFRVFIFSLISAEAFSSTQKGTLLLRLLKWQTGSIDKVLGISDFSRRPSSFETTLLCS